MTTMISFCGINCANCDAYQATQRGDAAEMERVAAGWRKEFNAPSITVDYVTCDGCTNLEGHAGGHCRECDIRACGIEHQVANCAHCAGYETCEKLQKFFSHAASCKATLDEIRRSL